MERPPRYRLHNNVICLPPPSSLKVGPDPGPGYAVGRPGDPSGPLAAKVFSFAERRGNTSANRQKDPCKEPSSRSD